MGYRPFLFKAALLAANVTGWSSAGAQQDPLWMIGNTAIHFPQQSGGSITAQALPTSYHPGIPDAYEYQGAVAQRTQNVQYDAEGNLLFFVVDGNIYNSYGLLIADRADDAEDTDCQVCFYGSEETHIVPVPNSCTQYYVMSLFFKDAGPTSESTLRVGVLDVSLNSDFPVYAGLAAVKGKFLNYYSEQGNQGYELDGFSADGWNAEAVVGDHVPDLVENYLWDGVIRNQGVTNVLRGAIVDLQNDERDLMVVRANQGVYMLLIHEHGIRRLHPPGSAGYIYDMDIYDSGANSVNDVTDRDSGPRGELAAKQAGNTLHVAFSGYYDQTGDPLQDAHWTWITYWKFDLFAPGQAPVVSYDLGPTNLPSGQPNPDSNPRIYSVDVYPRPPVVAPTDFLDATIQRPAICGLEFSPDARKVYFVKSTPFAYPNSGGTESNFGYVDLTWDLADPCCYYTFLPIAAPSETRKLADTQLGINVGPDGTGQALYMLGADATGDYWLGSFSDPNNPNVANWQAHTLDLDAIASRSTPDGPTQYRLLNHRVSGNSAPTLNCCNELVAARDQSGTITSSTLPSTWMPGSNPFFNSTGPLYVATELRFATGAHVTASDLELRFAQDAVVIIEKGASFKCTNCTFTTACEDSRWKGIEVWGNTAAAQVPGLYPANQGKLELIGSHLENAEIGILVASRANTTSATGGVVICRGRTVSGQLQKTVIKNCREGVKFYPYQGFLPGLNTPFRNLGRFTDCVFTIDAGYPVQYDFLRHAYLWKVDGLQFTACAFENTLPDAFFGPSGDFPGSASLGHGIYSLDANYFVRGACSVLFPGGTCPAGQFRASSFTGLDHGIHARKSMATIRNFTVDKAVFTNNICGVYADGVVGFKVTNNTFNVGGRNVEMTGPIEDPHWQGRHRGIFSTSGYSMIVDDNTLTQIGSNLTEGIVIGYSHGHNDMVFRNHAINLERGFIGEGECADPDLRASIGLHFQCNTNEDVGINLWSRQVEGQEEPDQTIRTVQGSIWRVADNTFDREPTRTDIKNTNGESNSLLYWWAAPEAPYRPINNTPNYVQESNQYFNTGTLLTTVRPANNCVLRVIPIDGTPGPGPGGGGMMGVLNDHKLEYVNHRYLYNDLLDGGNTDEAVQVVIDSWPQDAWQLRDYLLGLSPYVSVEVLMEAMNKPYFPAAMKAEVCIANPDATKKDGFLKWLETECQYPLDGTLIASIVASWETKTYRTQLETSMAFHHGEMTHAATVLLDPLQNDTVNEPLDSMRVVWQQVRTKAARYAEALTYLQEQKFSEARSVVQGIPAEHDLKFKEEDERERMLAMIEFFKAVHGNGRTEAQLTSAEVGQLETLIDGVQDRPGRWVQNLLCFAYDRCVAAPTGGKEGDPKSFQRPKDSVAELAGAGFTLYPNPAINWVAVDYDLKIDPIKALLVVKDITGRQVASFPLTGTKGQRVVDTRGLAKGPYAVELVNDGNVVQAQKLIVQ